MAKDKDTTEQNQKEEEVTEFAQGEPHPDTPKSVLEEQGIEVRDYEGKKDDAAADATWEKLKARKSKRHTAVLPDPENPGEVLTFVYRRVRPGDSVLLHDVAIVTGMIYNQKHEKPNDTMQKAVEEGRVEEFLQVMKNNRYYHQKVLSLGLERTIADIEENIHQETLVPLSKEIRGGAVPRSETDPKTDVDIFPPEAQGQESGETAQES